MLKDYYQILNISPQAGADEIKQAYRRLAMQYHPDKNAGDAYADVQFKEVKEAYEVLTDPARRDAYLQQRWYLQSQGKTAASARPVTPPDLLLQSLELEKHVATLDSFRLNQEGLFGEITTLLSDDHIQTLHSFGEKETNRSIIRTLLLAARPLSFRHLHAISIQMEKLAADDEAALYLIHKALKEQKRKHFWERYQTLFALLMACLLCLFIYLLAR